MLPEGTDIRLKGFSVRDHAAQLGPLSERLHEVECLGTPYRTSLEVERLFACRSGYSAHHPTPETTESSVSLSDSRSFLQEPQTGPLAHSQPDLFSAISAVT